jgi:hypothetical protein
VEIWDYSVCQEGTENKRETIKKKKNLAQGSSWSEEA